MVPHIRYTAGGSIFAASMLCSDGHDIVIHWDGGRHHAHCSKASGFCYVNDIVLGLQYLRTTFSRIFYLDLDIHYGDGVESAFPNSISIYPLSIHHASVGYFPNTGLEMSKYKIPLSQTLYNDTSFICVLEACLPKVLAAWKPDVVVIQCGADTLKSDPIGRIGSLSEKAYLHAFQLIKTYAPDAKWLLLGGGGYHHANTARLWAHLTGYILQRSLPDTVPTEYPFAELFEPFYDLELEKESDMEQLASHELKETLGRIEETFKFN
ncbi:histone chaperone [Coelomomyces lativittatus]|nr:histone chaperone [Coelomomyces lativittatus]